MANPAKSKPRALPPEYVEFNGKPLTHDGFFEKMFEMPDLARAFLKSKLPKEILPKLDLENITLEPKDFLNLVFKETHADMIYRVPILGMDEHLRVYILLEHKSYNDFWTVFQADQYSGQISQLEIQKAREEKRCGKDFRLSPVLVIIIHHGETEFTGPTNVRDVYEDLGVFGPYLPYRQAILFDLSSISEAEVPNDPQTPELYAVLRIMQVIFTTEIGTKSREVLEKLKPYSDDPKYRRVIRILWYYIVSAAKHLSKQDVIDVSKTVTQTTGENEMSPAWELFYAEGKAEGKAEGEANAILKVLRTRFGELPQEMCDKVRNVADLTALESHLVFAVTCVSLEEFAKSLG